MSSFFALSRGTRAYIAGVVLASVVVAFLLISNPSPVRVPTNQILLLIAIFSVGSLVSELRVITTPAGDQKTIVSAPFIASILLLGPTYTLPAVPIAIIGSHLIFRRPWPRAAFNTAQYVLTIGVSGLIYQAIALGMGGTPVPSYSSPPEIVAMLALSVAYFVINSGLVAGVVAISERRSYFYIWNLANVEMLVQYAVMIVVGIIIAMLWEAVPWSVALVLVILFGVYVSFALAESLQVAQRDLLLRMDELQRRTAELALLNQINNAITHAADLADLWEVVYEQAGRVFDVTCFFVALLDGYVEGTSLDGRTDRFRITFGRGAGARITDRVFEANRGIAGLLRTHPEPVRARGDEVRALDVSPSIVAPPYQSLLAVPLIVEGMLCGMIVAESSNPDAYEADDLRIVAAIADQAAVAVQRARLQKEATETRAMQRLNLLKTEFISSVSHELRSPLTPIVGFSELLSTSDIGPGDVREMASEIHSHAQRMQRLVDDLLDVSRMESGGFRIEVVDLDLVQLLERAVSEFALDIEHHRLVFHRPGVLSLVRGDPLRLRQVIDNLLANAVKYSPDGGRIDVTARECDSEVMVAVSDHGIGLAPDKLGRLFEKFYRVDNALAHRVRGSGLGLSIVKHIIDAHGGRIWVDSVLGRGSTFTFALPVSPLAREITAHPRELPPSEVPVAREDEPEEDRTSAQAHITG